MNQKELKEYMDNLYFDMRDNIKYKDYMIQKFYNMKNNNEKLENVIYGLLDEIVTMSENYNINIHDGDSNYNYYRKVFNEIQKQKEEIISE